MPENLDVSARRGRSPSRLSRLKHSEKETLLQLKHSDFRFGNNTDAGKRTGVKKLSLLTGPRPEVPRGGGAGEAPSTGFANDHSRARDLKGCST